MPAQKEYHYHVQIWLREPITYMNGTVEMTNANWLGFHVMRYPQATEGLFHAGEWVMPIVNIKAVRITEIDEYGREIS